jgi:hypothetical protein
MEQPIISWVMNARMAFAIANAPNFYVSVEDMIAWRMRFYPDNTMDDVLEMICVSNGWKCEKILTGYNITPEEGVWPKEKEDPFVYYVFHRGPKTKVYPWEKRDTEAPWFRGWTLIGGPFLLEETANSVAVNYAYTPRVKKVEKKPYSDAMDAMKAFAQVGVTEDELAEGLRKTCLMTLILTPGERLNKLQADPTTKYGEIKILGLRWWINTDAFYFKTTRDQTWYWTWLYGIFAPLVESDVYDLLYAFMGTRRKDARSNDVAK